MNEATKKRTRKYVCVHNIISFLPFFLIRFHDFAYRYPVDNEENERTRIDTILHLSTYANITSTRKHVVLFYLGESLLDLQ